jgi:hypothetical protein
MSWKLVLPFFPTDPVSLTWICDVQHQRPVNEINFSLRSAEQAAIAERINQATDAARVPINRFNRIHRKEPSRAPCCCQSALNIGLRFFDVKPLQMIPHRNPLHQLWNTRHPFSKFRLAKQHKRQQKPIIHLIIHQEPDLVKDPILKNRLSLVNDKDRIKSLPRVRQQMLVQTPQLHRL